MRILIAEDQPLARERLAEFLVEAGCEVVAQHGDGASAIRWLEAHAGGVDALFLDIHMPGQGGMEIAERFPHLPSVFVTAFDEYAVQAHARAAVDYLLKPVSRDRVATSVERVARRIRP